MALKLYPSQTSCLAPGCNRKLYVRGMCSGHYQRWRRIGIIPPAVSEAQVPLVVRFWSKVEVYGPASCWVWRGATNKGGYGVFTEVKGGKTFYYSAHRLAWKLVKGREAPAKKDLDHLCLNRLCVNPFHLEPVPHKENIRRIGLRRGTFKTRSEHLAKTQKYATLRLLQEVPLG